jgi:RNA recognition motif-containing protein
MDIQVLNLSMNIADADIRKLFSPFGEVAYIRVLRDKWNGRPKGSAVISMPVEAQGRQAIVSLDQTFMDGKKISVDKFQGLVTW